MNIPRLEVYLNEDAKFCISKVERVGAASRLMIEIDLEELKSYGADGAAGRIGSALINILSLWHKKEFETWNSPSAYHEGSELDDFGIAHSLIEKSLSNKTSVHVHSIETLLTQAADAREDVKRFIEESWPIIRQRLERFDPA